MNYTNLIYVKAVFISISNAFILFPNETSFIWEKGTFWNVLYTVLWLYVLLEPVCPPVQHPALCICHCPLNRLNDVVNVSLSTNDPTIWTCLHNISFYWQHYSPEVYIKMKLSTINYTNVSASQQYNYTFLNVRQYTEHGDIY